MPGKHRIGHEAQVPHATGPVSPSPRPAPGGWSSPESDTPRIGASSSPAQLCAGHPQPWRKCIAVVSSNQARRAYLKKNEKALLAAMSVFEKIEIGLEEAIAYEQGLDPADVSALTLAEVQKAFRGVAEELGIEPKRMWWRW